MHDRLSALLEELVLLPGLSGHEDRVRRRLAAELAGLPLDVSCDRLGNLVATLPGDAAAPVVMLFAHMDQIGFVVRRIEPSGLVRVERVGGVPHRALAAQAVRLCIEDAPDVAGVIGVKSHHAATADERVTVTPYAELGIDVGAASATEVRALGIDIGTPVVYEPRVLRLAGSRMAATALDDRAGCAIVTEVARALAGGGPHPTVHLVFSVQEEFTLRGAVVAANALRPDIAIQVDLALASDTPEMDGYGEVRLGGGPAISLYSFHGRGTLNGTIPHPALPRLFAATARAAGLPLQRTAHTGVLTDSAYVQVVGDGVACLDVCFPCRYSHSALEVCDLGDLEATVRLLVAAIRGIDADFSLDRDTAG